jgi:general secretion pathway protein A
MLLVGFLVLSGRSRKIANQSGISFQVTRTRAAWGTFSKMPSSDRQPRRTTPGLPGKIQPGNDSKNTFQGAAMIPTTPIERDFPPAISIASLTEQTQIDVLPEPQIADCSVVEERVENEIGNAAEFSVEEMHQDLEIACAEQGERPAPDLLAFYGFRQQPFDVTPDPAYLYFSPVHREAMSAISLGVENLRGFIALIAEPGMGKTTLLNKLMEELRDSARVVFLFQTQCNSGELLRYLLAELEVEYIGMDIVAMHKALSQALFEEMLQGRRFVLIVDEAQNLQDSVLETIRLLSDYETTHSKLIQIVLAGQPQLVEILMRPGLAQLRQRIAVLASLKPLDATETAEYVEHRLCAAGRSGNPLFSPEALQIIAESSAGVPRTINNICFNAMMAGYLQKQKILDAEIVKKVVSKLDLELLVWSSQPDVPDTDSNKQVNGAAGSSNFTKPAHSNAAVLNAESQQTSETDANNHDKAKTSTTVTGKLQQVVRSQAWSKKPDSRIDVSFERDPASGVTVADRHYCSSFYVNGELASSLQVGKPIRVKIEQD